MYTLEKINKIESKIKECVSELSKEFVIKKLKTQDISAGVKKGKPYLIFLDKEDPTRKQFVIQQNRDWTELHFILTSDKPKYTNKPEIILFKHRVPEKYNWSLLRFSTRKHKSIENTEMGAIIATVIDRKYKTDVEYYQRRIMLSYDFETNFEVKKITRRIRQFNLVADKIEKEIPILTEEIKNNPKKYIKVERHW